MAVNYGSKRLAVGAGYGLRDWLAQRVTGVVMAVFTIVVIAQVLLGPSFGYPAWAAIFAQPWMKILSFATLLALLYHAWVGVRDIWMDYVKPVGLRLVLHVLSIVWLVGCAGWAFQVLGRI